MLGFMSSYRTRSLLVILVLIAYCSCINDVLHIDVAADSSDNQNVDVNILGIILDQALSDTSDADLVSLRGPLV